MCLAVPMKIISREGNTGTVEAGEVRYRTDLRLLPAAAVGDFVLIHAGFAIQMLDVAEAEETLRLFSEMGSAMEKESGA
jgi:hydrogenase expression/formation protein HypC